MGTCIYHNPKTMQIETWESGKIVSQTPWQCDLPVPYGYANGDITALDAPTYAQLWQFAAVGGAVPTPKQETILRCIGVAVEHKAKPYDESAARQHAITVNALRWLLSERT